MEYILNTAVEAFQRVALSLLHNWPYIAASVVVATILPVWVNTERVTAFLMRHRRAGVAVATAAAVGTPLCSCGTTAVVLGMMASSMTWAPIVAFMVASPLSSPEGLVYSAGLFGWPFALAFFLFSIILGLAGGGAAGALERRGWLANQSRLRQPQPRARCGCGQPPAARPRPTASAMLRQLCGNAVRLLAMYLGFAFIGYFVNGLIPASWVPAAFGAGNIYNVPLAATLGLPLYINSEASLPVIKALMDAGMSQGAAMAFMIAGSGTSIGAIAGALTIARWRVVALVTAVLWAGAVMAGFAFNGARAAGLV